MTRMSAFRPMDAALAAPAAALAAWALPTAALAQQAGPNYGSRMWDAPWHGWFLGPIMMIAFVAIAVAVVVLLVRWLDRGGAGPRDSHARSALVILEERYARGEIGREEFEERRLVLGG